MFIQAPPTTSWSVWFMAYVSPLILSFLAVVIPAAALYLKARLDANHAATVVAAEVNAAATAKTDAKVDTVITQTNGVNQKLQDHIDAQNMIITTLQAQKPPIA